MNDKIIRQFEYLLKQIQFEIDTENNTNERMRHMYRYAAIVKSLDIIRKYNKVIKSGKDLADINGIGTGTVTRIDEIIKSGKLSEIRDDILDDKYMKYIDELENVYGIGRKTALHLFKTYNVKSVSELQKLYKSNAIPLSDTIAKGLKYYGKIKTNIPRLEIDAISNKLLEILRQIDPQLLGIVCGSYRRLTMTSNDIDMLVVHPMIQTKAMALAGTNLYLHKFVKRLIDNNIIIESLTSIDVATKYMGICRLNSDHELRRIDIRFIPYESYYYAMMYFTGSKDFNIRVRSIAIGLGYMLNEYGLYDESGRMIRVNSEKEIFDKLGIDYIPPELR